MSSYRELPLWGPIAAAAISLAWLLPNAHYPWVGFHKDAYLGLVMALVGLVVFARATFKRTSVGVPPLALLLLAMGTVVWLQHALGRPQFFGEAFVGSLYFCGAAMAIVCASAWERDEPGAPARLIFLGVGVAGVATMGIVLAQWLELTSFSTWLSGLPANGRVVGNLNQPNNAATLLVWGLVSLFWLRSTGRIGSGVWLFSATPLLGCLVLTGSRINYLSLLLMLLVGAGFVWKRRELHSYRAPLLVLLSVFLGFLILQGVFGAHPTEASPFERQFAGDRMLAYKALSMAVFEEPWLGFGFNQTIYAQIAARQLGYPLPALFTWAHNAFLDIAVWFGLPMLLITVGLVLKLVWQVRFMRMNPDRLACLLALMAFGAHAMVELPHAYAVFLLPACFMLGTLIGASGAEPVVRIRAWAALLAMLSLSVALAVTVTDYFKVEKSFFDWRFKVQRVGTYHPMSVPDVWVLDQFHALIRGFRSADQPLAEDELEDFRKSVLYFPSPYALQLLTLLQTKAGKSDEAQETIRIAASVLSPGDFADMARQWLKLQQKDAALKAVHWTE